MKKTKARVAVYPGSFDPIHLGHLDIIERVSELFDETIVLVSHSLEKPSFFSVTQRQEMIEKAVKKFGNVSVDNHAGLTVDYMRSKGANIIVRGLRAVVDFEYELSMANMNKKLAPEIETMLIFSHHEYYFVSSRGVKEVAANGGVLTGFVPLHVIKNLKQQMARKK